ncbi:MAG: hypothetical protein WC476_12575, partial [Phycisphaerae bacterium]
EPSKRNPRQMFFYRPRVFDFPAQTKQLPDGKTISVRRTVKLFSIGAISISVRVPFCVSSLDELVAYHDLRFADTTLEQDIYDLAESVRRDLEPYCVRPVPAITQAEAYTVFCLNNLPPIQEGDGSSAEQWLKSNRRQIAALLTQEENAANLADQEISESTQVSVSYYKNDLVVVDWDSAIAVGKGTLIDDVLHIMELANVQLVELAAYDRILDDSLQLSYKDISQLRFSSSRDVHKRLREIRIDLSRLSDELSNITKFFGDWHLAQIHGNLANRFHLGEWHRIIEEKLRMLGDLYQILQQDKTNFLMLVLETTIVLLFIIDLILLFFD